MRLRLIQTYTPNGHLYRVTYSRCRIDTINSPDDGHMAAPKHVENRNKHTWKRIVPQVGYLQRLRSVHVLCVLYQHPSRLVMWLQGVVLKCLKLIFSKLSVICFIWTDDGIFRRCVGDTVYITPLSKKKLHGTKYFLFNSFCFHVKRFAFNP